MKKNLVITIIFLIIVLSLDTVSSSLLGDVDNNGKVGATDYILVRKHILKTSTLTGDKLKRADVNGDNKINAGFKLILRFHSVSSISY